MWSKQAAHLSCVLEKDLEARHELIAADDTDAVLLIDASNAINALNRAAALHNIRVLCLVIAAYVINTYRQPARLFTKKKKEDRVSGRNTTGRSPCHGSLRLKHSAFNFESKASSSVKQCWFADDNSGPGSTTEIKKL